MSRLLLVLLICAVGLAVAGSNTARAGAFPTLIFPFPDNQTWTISQGYSDCDVLEDFDCMGAYALGFTRSNPEDASGQPVRAAAAGMVVESCACQGVGSYVRIDHPGGYSTAYAHLQAGTPASVGTNVVAGQQIGLAGCTGDCVDPHIHFALYTVPGFDDVKPEPMCGHTGFAVGQQFTNCVPDIDGDGVRDELDNCNGAQEDADLYEEQDGCPEAGPDEGLRGDFNGDGRSDVAHVCCGNEMYTWLSNADGTYSVVNFSPGGSYDMQLGTWRTGDFNGDGDTDLAHLCCSNYMHTWFSNGDGSYSITFFSPGDLYLMQSGQWRTGDFNGDGKSDLAHLCCSNYMHTWFANGDGSFSIAFYSPGDLYQLQLGTYRTGDFNGDGKTDLLHLCCDAYVHTWLSNGDGTYSAPLFDPPDTYIVPLGSVYVADVNGDGKSDVLHICCDTYLHTWLSNGDGSYNVTIYSPPGHILAGGTWKTADINGDYKSDLVHICCPASIRTLISNGDGTYNFSAATSGMPGYQAQLGSWQVGDINGDGRSDLMHRCCNNDMYTWSSNGNATFTVTNFAPAGGLYEVQAGSWLTGDFTSDHDGDGFLDGGDNCPAVANIPQSDGDGDLKGDACDVAGSGDIDCNAIVNSVDALKILRHSAALSVTQTEPCLDLGQPRLVAPPDNWLMGDVNCSNVVNAVDALLVLRAVAGLSVAIPGGCPQIKPA